jgi:site-specific DNA-methyltransferase (adenine-specific)
MNINSNQVSNLHQNPQLSGIICYKHFSNRVHHCDFLKNDLPDKSVNLIIADFPYFEVKGDFDFIWNSFEEFLAWVELCAKEFKRLLKDNGTLFVYGHAKKIAYKQVIFDKYFNLENNLCIEFNRQTKKGVENFRCFAPVTERCLMYSNEEKVNECTVIHKDLFSSLISKINETAKIEDFIKCFLDLKIAKNIESAKVLASYKTGKHATRFDFLSEEMYNNIGNFNYTYEQLRQEYEQLRRPFNNFMKLFDVMKFDQEAHITKNYDHETQKPETLTRALILTCSRENDLVLVPFAGSGTECAMAKKEKRNFIGFDINPVYVEMSNKRCDAIQSGLF